MAVTKINGGMVPPKQGLYCIAHHNEKRGWRIVPSTGAGVALDDIDRHAFNWIREANSWYAANDYLVILNAADLTESDFMFSRDINCRLRHGLYWINPKSDAAKWVNPDLLKEQVRIVGYATKSEVDFSDHYVCQPLAGGVGPMVLPVTCLVADDPYSEPKPAPKPKRLRIVETEAVKAAKEEAKRIKEANKAAADKVKADAARAGAMGSIQSALSGDKAEE